MKYNPHYCSHLPVLIKTLQITNGDVLELGTGLFSTPVIHWLCIPHGRYVYSLEYDPKYLAFVEGFTEPLHKIEAVPDWDWDKVDIEKQWDVVLVDHSPGERRKVEITRLANLAKYIIVHDTDWRNEKHYHYADIYPLFKYRYDYQVMKPRTTILSNFIDLKDFIPC